jgi:hypothetical protein
MLLALLQGQDWTRSSTNRRVHAVRSEQLAESTVLPNAAIALGGTLVFVNDAAQDIASDNPVVADSRGHRAGERLVELETAVGPGFVVVADVLGENDLEMSSRDNQQVIETVLSDGPHEPFGKGVRPRRGDRSLYGPDANRGEYRVEAAGELGIPVADEESKASPSPFEVGGEVAGHLGKPGTIGMGRDPEQVHPSSIDLDDEQHVEASKCDRVNREEVSGQNSFGLGTEKLAPGGTRAPRRRRESVSAKDGCDAALGDDQPELLELADDAEIAPTRVLPSQTNDQFDRRVGQGRAAWPTVGVGPMFPHEGLMPANDRLRSDQEACPPSTRNEPRENTDDCSIRPGKAGTGRLAPEHGQLMAQHQDLCVLGHRVHPVNVDRIEDAADESVEEREGHGLRAWSRPSCLVKPRAE